MYISNGVAVARSMAICYIFYLVICDFFAVKLFVEVLDQTASDLHHGLGSRSTQAVLSRSRYQSCPRGVPCCYLLAARVRLRYHYTTLFLNSMCNYIKIVSLGAILLKLQMPCSILKRNTV